jgi:hypothetical protein
MSAIRAKNDAVKKYMELSRKIGYKPNGVNLRTMNARQIDAAYVNLQNYAKQNTTPRIRNVVKNRSAIIKQIKEINPSFKSQRGDTYDTLLVKYRQNLPKKSFLSSISNYNLVNFLKKPVDEASITTTAKSLIESIDSMKITSDYYLVMSVNTSSTDLESNISSTATEYKVISNISAIRELLNKISSNNSELIEQTIGHGSDTQILYSLLKTYNSTITLTWYSISSYKRVHSGAYFKYYNKTKLDLTRYQIFTEDYDSSKEDEINCLIYAFMMSDKVSRVALDNLKLSIFHKEVKARDLKTIAKQLDITIRLRYDPKQSASVFNKGCKDEVAIGLVDGHYFIDEPTNITKAALDDYEEVKNDISFPNIQPKKFKQKPLSSYQVISTMFSKYNEAMLTPITLNNISNKQTIEKLIEYEELRAPQANCSCKIGDIKDFNELKSLLANCSCKKNNHEFKDYGRLSTKKPFKGFFKNANTDPNENYDIWFIDTETFIKEKLNYHIANTLCAIKYSEKYDTFQEYEFFGLDCVKSFLDSLNKNSIIYAHNMAFDFRVFIDHLYELQTPIESGTKLKQIQGKYQRGTYINKEGETKKSFIHLLFKDSYSFLPEKLSKLPEMLDLPCGDKEVFPYTLINEENFDKCVPIAKCREHVKKGLRKAFTLNAKKIGAFNEEDKSVDMKKYTIHYCMQDTRILAHAFVKFRKQILQVCKLDILPRLSLPQLADDFLKSRGVYDGCFAISGISQDFIRRCCVGGRVMCNSNKKWHIKAGAKTMVNGQEVCDEINSGAIADFDAVSLYPSAMSMMKGYVKGLPKVLTNEQISNFDSIKKSFDAYYVEIEVINHTINRDFPLLSIKDRDGIRDFTNDINGKRFYLDNIALEDLVEFQGVAYKVIRGYYFNDGYNTQITETINFMFNERLRLKKVGNNLQNVYKLLMNASYGKLIQKAIKTSKKFIEASELRRYVAKNYKFIDSYDKINDDLYVIRENKSSITHFTACHIASNILSMSKRLMNRVMCLADDNDIKIYYQDTDSMHLHEKAIPILSELFKQKYGSELIGKAMCQFHTDFSVSDKSATNIRAVESVFIGKKVYIDKLKYTNGYGNTKYDYHIRVKGVPTQSIRDFDADYMNTYGRLFAGEALEFDLSAYCPLQIDADYRARANTKCVSRKLQY